MTARPAAAVGLAAALAVALTSAALSTAPAALATREASPPPTSPDDFVLPDGYRSLVDDTERITVAVPEAWADIDTTPADEDGVVVPQIQAATDRSADTFDAAGVRYVALPFTADEEALYAERFQLESGCRSQDVVPYDDGAFAGRWWQLTECGATGDAQWHAIVASPDSEALTAVVIVRLRGPQDEEALDVVLQSFNLTPTATWPATSPTSEPPATTSTTSTTSTTTTSPSTTSSTSASSTSSSSTSTSSTPASTSTLTPVSTLVASTAPAGEQAVVDRTRSLGVNVPASWTEVNTTASIDDTGLSRPTILASPDIDEFLGGYDTPGARLFAVPATIEPAVVLANVDYSNQCTAGALTTFDDGRFVGLTQTWSQCDQTTTQLVVVVARPVDRTFTVFVEVQSPAGDRAVDVVLGSFGVLPGATVPTPKPMAPAPAPPPIDPGLLQGAVPAGSVTIVDRDNSITVDVPSSWTDQRTDAVVNDDLTNRPRIVASPDAESMFDSWATPGVVFVEYPAGDPRQLLANRGYAESCADGGLQSFDSRGYRGFVQTWSRCGDTESRIVMLAVSPADGSAILYVEVQVPDADDTGLRTVLATFRQL